MREQDTRKKGTPVQAGRGYHGIAASILVLAAAALAGGYLYRAAGFKNTYLPHTVVNGMEVAGCTAEEVKDMMASGIRDYSLSFRLRDNGKETLAGTEIGLHTVFDGSLEEIIRQQNPYAWPRYLIKGPSYDIQAMIAYDEAALEKKLKELNCFDAARVVTPADAYLSDYISGQGYSIIPEIEGNELDFQKVKEAAQEAVPGLEQEVDLEALGCYREPAIRSGNSALVTARDARNRYVNQSVTYTFGSRNEVLDGSEIHKWLSADGIEVTLNRDKIAEYVKEMAIKYNTAYTKRPFMTSYGQTVEVTGFYGWRINQTAETEELVKILEQGLDVTREPVYSQTAASHDGADYGDTYAEVNLTAQHMFFYKDGQKILESDFVSGNLSRGHTTPPGLFAITYKQRNAVLKGEGYASPVKYWMPFNGGIGFHDASWRYSFGGSIYKTSGSHGCVNMPSAAAEKLFDYVYAGMPVICYDLPGTENSGTSSASGAAQPPAAGQQPAAPPTAAETAPGAPPVPEAEETPSAQTQLQEAPLQAAGETQPRISIDPVGQATAGASEAAKDTDGYGPAFRNTEESGGPGVR